jgi:hypothetical protein
MNDSTGQLIVNAYDFEPVHPAESVAVTVILNVPNAPVVPSSDPAPVSVIPAGSVPDVNENVYGAVPPDAVIVCA